MHLPILDAVEFNIPVVSAPLLQECTSRHVYGMLRTYGIGPRYLSEYPDSVEDYAVYALSLQQDMRMRSLYRYTKHDTTIHDASDQRSFRKRKVLTIPKVDTGEDDRVKGGETGENRSVHVPSHGVQLLQFMERLMNSAL